MVIGRSYVAGVIALSGACLEVGCGGYVTHSDAGLDRKVPADVTSDASAEASEGDTADPCPAGTCRFSSDPSGACLPPGGAVPPPDSAPSLAGCCMCGSNGICTAEC